MEQARASSDFLFFQWDMVSVSPSSGAGWAIGTLLPDTLCCASSLQERATTSLPFCWTNSPEEPAPRVLGFFRGGWLTMVTLTATLWHVYSLFVFLQSRGKVLAQVL